MPLVPDRTSVERVVSAPPSAVFALLADPVRHRDIDGSGTVRDAVEGSRRLRLGDRFGMQMRAGLGYTMVNEVVELEEDRRIAWQTRPVQTWAQRFVGGRIWRYELEAVEGGTRVRETWDISAEAVKPVVWPLRRRDQDQHAPHPGPDRGAGGGMTTTAPDTLGTVPYDEALQEFEPVIGLETHVELGTASKMFCGCATAFGAEPNTQTCPVCLGLPGALPVVNAQAIESTIRIGLALHCDIASWCRFARKNYFYPDMPKNFQTSQYDEPLCTDGYLDVEVPGADGQPETVRIPVERVHLEEDTGKTLHVGGATGRIHGASHSLVDYNRAGIPLVEIVTKPVVGTGTRPAEVAKAYVTELRDLLRGLDVSDVRMEQGSMRCDVNVSLNRPGQEWGTRSETKNVNSLRSVERAVRSEVERQAARLRAGERIVQETRHFSEATGTSSPGRSKEEATDYRYFPEPDLVPVAPDPAWVAQLQQALPEPPSVRRRRLLGQLGLSALDSQALVNAGVLDLVLATVEAGAPAEQARNWWLGPLAQAANTSGGEAAELAITPVQVARVVALVAAGTLTAGLARQVVEGVLAGEGTPDEVVAARGLAVVSDEGALGEAVDAALAAQPAVADKVRAGKVQAVGALVGAVMKATRGQADAAVVRRLLLERLGVDA